MPQDVKTILAAAEEKMEMATMHLEEALSHIRAGKANVKILDGIFVDYYGANTPLTGVATVSTPDAKTIIVQPWDRKMIPVIEKALMASSVGITPENNGEMIRLGIPPLTNERRVLLTKQAKAETENAKVSIRNNRRDANEALKKAVKEGLPEDMQKDGEAQMQKVHDRYIKRVEEIYAAKEKEILTV